MNGHLFKGFDGRLHLVDTDHQTMVVGFHPFDANLERIQRRAPDLEGAVRRNVPSWNERDEGIRIADSGGSEVTSRAEVQRQGVQVLARHARGNLGALRVEHRGIGDDVHFFGEVPHLQLGVNPCRLPDEDPDAFLAEAAEAGQLDVQVVGADGYLGQRVVAGLGRDGFVPRPVFGIFRDHARARHHAAVGIDDSAR